MANTLKRGYILPTLGTKPWKAVVDFNWNKIDADVGGLIDGTITAGVAANILPAALTPFVISVTGTLSGVTVPASGLVDVTVTHSNTVVFDVPSAPAFQAPAGVSCILLGNLPDLGNPSYGGAFSVRVQNDNSGNVDGASISWKRKGIRIG